MASGSGRTRPAHNAVQLVRMGVHAGQSEFVVALAGNPNVGKSTVFNALTGLRQHTGNWPGKTVSRAEGGFVFQGRSYKLVDLPGTYSLLATSTDEEIARDFVLFGQPDVTLVVIDATRLERNLNLALQVMEITDRVVVCLNLMDEARRQGLTIDAPRLAASLGVPVVVTEARFGAGIATLLQAIDGVATGRIVCRPVRVTTRADRLQAAVEQLGEALQRLLPGLPNTAWLATRLLDGDRRLLEALAGGELVELARFAKRAAQVDAAAAAAADAADAADARGVSPDRFQGLMTQLDALRWELGPHVHQSLAEDTYAHAARLADAVVRRNAESDRRDWGRPLDRLLTNRWTGFPLMVAVLAVVLWVSVVGANWPSHLLSALLVDTGHAALQSGARWLGVPHWLDGLLLDGCYLATAWVISVMLPPMAIFFPLFTLLEDFGYLPRVAFNLDRLFQRCGAHGKQALTMCMGFGCNAAGVVAARVIDSPRERLIAIITNNFSLCNGRWPTQILVATIFVGALVPGYLAGAVAALAVVGVAVLGVLTSLGVSWLISRTLLQGEPSTFHLELPPFRPPRLLQTLYTSLIDRTLIVLGRAVTFAIPAGAVIWLIANVDLGGRSLAQWCVGALDPVGTLIGLNGVILLAYVVAIPANEIVIPTVLMVTALVAGVGGPVGGSGALFELESVAETATLLRGGGWTLLTGLNLMLFSLLHNPCSTTIFTIYRETGSLRWTAVATFLPLALGVVVCFFVAQVWRLLGG